MRILFITPRLPYPPRGGDKQMVYNHLSGMCAQVESIHVLSLIESPADEPLARELQSQFPNLTVDTCVHSPMQSMWRAATGVLFSRDPLQVLYYKSRAFRRQLAALASARRFDVCVIHLARMVQYADVLAPETVRILALSDCLTLRYTLAKPYVHGIRWLIEAVESARMARYETTATALAHASFVHTRRDRDKLIELGSRGRIEVIPIGTHLDHFRPGESTAYEATTFSFLGNLHSVPNRDAVRFFIESVWPLVRAVLPESRLQVIGINAPAWLTAMHGRDGIVVTGPVDDVRPFLVRSCLTVCPIRIGAGTQNKILESLACGVPVVSTRLGFEGLDAGAGNGVVVADTPTAIADAIAAISNDARVRRDLSSQGRAFVEKNYVSSEKSEQLLRLMLELAAAKGNS